MIMKAIVLSLGLVAFGLTPNNSIWAQDEDVRGAFLTTRPKAGTAKPKAGTTQQRPSRRRPKPVTPKPGPATPSPEAGTGNTPRPAAQRIGVGLTLFMRDSNGMAVRTDPSRDFKYGDRVRVLLETNADGYLYIFNTTNDGPPVMIYPDPELDEAGNYLQAHVPFEIPSSMAPEERLRWFSFDQNAGAERLYFVFTREPLSGVPTEDDLITFCREKKVDCPWQPSTEVWAQLQAELKAAPRVTKSATYGKGETTAERQGATRGIGLNRDDPEPSLIMLTGSTDKKVLVVTLDLNHKAVSVLPN